MRQFEHSVAQLSHLGELYPIESQTYIKLMDNRSKPLSFHSVSFGPATNTLRRMAQIALEVQSSAPRDPLLPATALVDSSFAEALDTVRCDCFTILIRIILNQENSQVRLAETFLGIAESLRKPRGSLLH